MSGWIVPLLFVSFFLYTSCGITQQRDTNKQPFTSVKTFLHSQDQNREQIVVDKGALGQPILLQTSSISQRPTVEWGGIKSRVVRFIKRGNSLIMLESPKYLVIGERPDTSTIIARFDIKKESAGNITFDFNQGFSHIFVSGDWYTQDYNSNGPGDSLKSVKTEASYIDRTESHPHHFIIDQVVRAEGQSLRLRYYLSPYNENTSFESFATKKEDYDRFAFFEVAPVFKQGDIQRTYATKFDTDNDIVFALTSNTPKEYVEAVKEGVLYWNKAFGKDQLKAIMAPKGVLAPSYDYNLIEWVDNEIAGYAYADAQADPYTGEIRHGQVYFPTVFAVSSLRRARALLERLENKSSLPAKKLFSLKGFTKRPLCHLGIEASGYAKALRILVDNNASDHRVREVSRDYVRAIVAHEVGHVLGLRHNFAGNLESNTPYEEREALVEDYIISGTVPSDYRGASSIMDYMTFIDEAMSGYLMKDDTTTMDYDRKAIELLYGLSPHNKDKLPLFCTDSHVQTYLDCERSDYGNSIIEFWYEDLRYGWHHHSETLFQTFVRGKSPPKGLDAIPVSKVRLYPENGAWQLLYNQAKLLQLFGEEPKLLRIHRSFPALSGLDKEELKEKTNTYIGEKIQKLGGVEAVFAPPSDTFTSQSFEAFQGLIATRSQGTGPGGEYSFSPEEQTKMLAIAERYFQKLGPELVKVHTLILGGKQEKKSEEPEKDEAEEKEKEKKEEFMTFREWPLETDLFDVFESKVRAIVFPDPTNPMKPRYKYELRQAAVNLMLKDRSQSPLFEQRKATLAKDYKKALKEALGGVDIEKIDITALDAKTQSDRIRWVVENKKLLKLLTEK